MKKIFNLILLVVVSSFAIIGINEAVQAADAEAYTPGTVHVTFIRNKVAMDETVIFHNWGVDSPNGLLAASVNEDKTVYTCEYTTQEDSLSMGFIPVLGKDDGEGGLTQDWDNKVTFGGGNNNFDLSSIQTGGDLYVVLSENAKDGEYVSATATADERLAFIEYYAPAYEDTLGVHSWGWSEESTATGWASPLDVFKTIGHAGDGSDIKGALLKADSVEQFASAGFLVYAGDDSSKKNATHGDISAGNGDFVDYESSVLNITYLNSDVIYDNAKEFVEASFVFKILDMEKDSTTGELSGTYAKDPTTVIVKVSAEVLVPTVKTEGTEEVDEVLYTTEERQAMLAEYITITDADGVEVAIDHVDANLASATGTKEFVVILSDELDNTKEYSVEFAATEEMTASKEIMMDTEAPVITLIPSKSEIDLVYGEKIDASILPKYLAIDTRDGNITNLVYVKAGEGTVDSRTKGTYVVKLTVEDAWGNETQVAITYTVK